MEEEKNILCTCLGVDCVANDPVDINCGGPGYLGFDFSVPKEQTKEMANFIAETLNSFNIPLERIYRNGEKELKKEQVWTKERIVEEIKKESEYLIRESKRNYYKR